MKHLVGIVQFDICELDGMTDPELFEALKRFLEWVSNAQDCELIRIEVREQ